MCGRSALVRERKSLLWRTLGRKSAQLSVSLDLRGCPRGRRLQGAVQVVSGSLMSTQAATLWQVWVVVGFVGEGYVQRGLE